VAHNATKGENVKLQLITLIISVLIGVSHPGRAPAQHMFLDTDGDGVRTDRDVLSTRAASVDVWLQTDQDRSGAKTSVRDGNGRLPSVNSYEFILRASDGEVEWGEFTNSQPTMTVPFGPRHSKTHYYHGYGGLQSLPPGTYKLGRLGIRVVSGQPRLEFATRTSLWGVARTAFGSSVSGVSGDHTLKLGERSSGGRLGATGNAGDWADASGVTTRPPASNASEAIATNGSQLRFSARVSPNPWSGPGQIEVQTSRVGRIRLQIFDLGGRLVRTVIDEPAASPGTHAYTVDPKLGGRAAMAAGVYFYRLEASEGVKRGRIVILSK